MNQPCVTEAAPDPDRPQTPADPADAVRAAADAALLARMRSGDDRAFDELVAATGGRLLAVARRMLGDEQDAQDAVQEAYLGAFKSLDKFDGRSALPTWLHRITVNACLMRLRYRRRHPARPVDHLLPQFLEDGHQRVSSRPWRPGLPDGIQADELHALVRTKIEELPDAYREVIVLRDVVGLDTEESAEVLGIGLSAVKTRLQRARQALRTLLDPFFTASDA